MEDRFEMDAFSLSGKTVVITGACGILGKCFVDGLIKADASIAIIDVVNEVESFAKYLSLENKS